MEWDKIDLPEGVHLNSSFIPEREDGYEILFKYCRSCMKTDECEMPKELHQALGENYPLWFEAHIPVRTEKNNGYFGSSDKHVFCNEYESRQKNLPSIEKDISDGVERLLEVSGLALI